jgi:translational activator of cytochrome c oxidase 1
MNTLRQHAAELVRRECRTNNINRTLSNVRETLTRHGCVHPSILCWILSLTSPCSARQAPVKFMFRQRGYLKIAMDPNDIEDLFNTAESTQCSFDFDEWEDASSDSRGIEVSPQFSLRELAEPIEY